MNKLMLKQVEPILPGDVQTQEEASDCFTRAQEKEQESDSETTARSRASEGKDGDDEDSSPSNDSPPSA